MQSVLSPPSLRSARQASGLTLEQAAHEAGCSVRTLSRAERAESTPHVDLVARLAELYGVEIRDLFHDEDATAVAATLREVPGAAKEVAGATTETRSRSKEVEGSGRKSSKTQPARSLVAQRSGSKRVE